MGKATYLLKKAGELVREKRYDEAVEACLQATEADPADSRAWFGLGVCLFRVGNLDVARIALERAQQMDYPRAEEALARVSAAEDRRAAEGKGAKATVEPDEAKKRAAERPAAVQEPPPRPAIRPEEEKIELARHQRVMLVEDKPEDNRAVTEAIEGAIKDVEVVSVPYGLTTSATMSGAVDYDVAVLDWDMAPDAAVGLIQILKIKRPDMLVVCLTEDWDAETAVEILEAGADYHLVKHPHFASALPLILAQWARRDQALAEHAGGDVEAPFREAELGPDEQVHRSLVEGANAGIVMVGADGSLRYVNEGFCTMVDQTQEALLGRPIENIVTMADLESLRECLQTATDQGQCGGRLSLQRSDGSTFPAEVGMARLADGEETRLVITLVSVSDLERAERERSALPEAAVQTEGGLLTEVGGAISDMLFATDAEGTITWCNPAAVATAGYSEAQLVGMPLPQLAPEDEREKIESLLLAVLTEGQRVQQQEVLIVRGDGRRRWAELTLLPMRRDETSGPQGVEGILRDITDRKMTEAIRDILAGQEPH